MHMSQFRKISIVIPVYNEVNTIKNIIDQVVLINTFNISKEIIVVDDHSTDGTTELLNSINNPEIKSIHLSENQGKGAALKRGFMEAAGDIVIVQDGDSEYDPKEINKVLKPLVETKAKVVYGSRYISPSTGLGFWHSLFNKWFTFFGNWLLGANLTDIMTCYKAFDREVLNTFLHKLEAKRFGFEPEVTARVIKAGYKIYEVPISYSPRSSAEGKHMNLKGQLDSLKALIKYSIKKDL